MDLLRITGSARKIKLHNFKNCLESWKGVKPSCISVAKKGGMSVTYRLNLLELLRQYGASYLAV